MNIDKIIQNSYTKWKNKEFIYEKNDGKYEYITYGDFIHKVTLVGRALINLGLKDKKILIYGMNSIEYLICDMAITAYVGITVNINVQTSCEELKEIINNLNIDAIMYDKKLYENIENIKENNEDILYIDMQEFIQKLNNDDIVCFNFEKKDIDKCSKIIFSSGTTSNPKGVMLSLKNIFSGYIPLQKRAPLKQDDIVYLFLPLHHTYGNIYNFLYPFISGASIYLCSKIEIIETELKEVNPTVFCAVPLIYKKIYYNNINNLSQAFGNRIKYLFCGGTKFDIDIRKAYKDDGLPMFEAYALTETASSFSIEYANNDDYESVGTIFENIDVKIINSDELGNGEIIVKGDNVFLGYANNEKLTKQSFTDEGYFITGDYGYIKNNKLYLTSRKDNIIIGENGENVYPQEIEEKLKNFNNNIVKLKAYLKENKVNYIIYAKKDADVTNIDTSIKQYNLESTKKDCIKFYQIMDESQINFKG